MKFIIGKEGYVKLAPKQDGNVRYYQLTKDSQDEIDFCLNCTKKRCGGDCDERKEFIRNKKMRKL